ncbi:MAG: glycosyltransferase family 4 protein [Bacteroidota bacterium]
MKIAVNTRLMIPGRLDGIGWFTYETLRRITSSHPEHQFYFIFDRKFSKELVFSENVTPVIVHPPTRHPLLWMIWFEISVPSVLRRLGADIFLSTDGFLSMTSKVPQVGVIHDINFHHRPEDLPFFNRRYYRYYFPRFARKAARLATVSEYSRRDIINHYDIAEEKIDLVYNGANEMYEPIPELQKEKVRKKYADGAPYFIFVGNLHPRKNVRNLLRAFQLFREENKGDFKLIIVGEKFFFTRPIEDQLESMPYRKDVIFTGRLSSEELKDLLGAAFALTFVPFFEGFGIPLIEAMRSEIPVITSNVTSLPEIAGDAALYVNPESPGSIRDAMVRLVKEPGLREDLVLKGRARRKLYSWDNTAQALWSTVEKVLQQHA